MFTSRAAMPRATCLGVRPTSSDLSAASDPRLLLADAGVEVADTLRDIAGECTGVLSQLPTPRASLDAIDARCRRRACWRLRFCASVMRPRASSSPACTTARINARPPVAPTGLPDRSRARTMRFSRSICEGGGARA